MKTLYLHIGTTKTATTTIQKFCAGNRAVFESKGYVYPDFPFRYPRKGEDRNGLFLGTLYYDKKGVRHKDKEAEYFAEGMRIVHELFETYDSVVLSEERLYVVLRYKNSHVLEDLVEDARAHGYRIKMIIYLRRQDIYVESVWNQVVKMRLEETRSLEEYAAYFPYLDYYGALTTFAEAIGRENISVRRFAEVIKEPGILADFMEQIGLELTDEYVIGEAESNPGLYGNTIEIKRLINEIDGVTADDAIMFRHALPMSSIQARKNYNCSEQSPEERAALMERFEEGNRAIVEEFIGDGKPLFSSDYSGRDKRIPDNPQLLPDIIRSSAAVDIYLFRRLQETRKMIRHLRSDHEKQMEQIIREQNKKIAALEKQLDKQAKQLEKQSARIDRLRHPVRTLLGKRD